MLSNIKFDCIKKKTKGNSIGEQTLFVLKPSQDMRNEIKHELRQTILKDLRNAHFCTLGYCISMIEFVASLCLSFKCLGHMLSTQSIMSTCDNMEKNVAIKDWSKYLYFWHVVFKVPTVAGLLTRLSSLVWLNSRLITL